MNTNTSSEINNQQEIVHERSGYNQRRPNSNYTNRPRQNHNQNRNQNQRSYQKSRINRMQNDPNDQNESTELNENENDSVSNDQKNKIYNRRKLISMSSSNPSHDIQCICCLHELYTFVYYSCSHYVCLNCAVKMRVLCEKFDCPVCRQESKRVICSKKQINDLKNFDDIFINSNKTLKEHDKSGIYIDDAQINKEYEEIISNRCDICPTNLSPFKTFQELDYHVRKVHRRFYCELCMDNLKLFPYERKHYTREELAMHKRNGDRDDYSFKGHPLCEYCDQRFFDRDELYRHCRRDHYFCHFCDSDGIEEYYNDYNQLRTHFLKSHFLCELDGCSANAAQTHEYVVFRSDIDFQVHKKQKHAKSKSESKSLSKLNIEFNLNNSARDRYRRREGMTGAGRGRYTNNRDRGRESSEDGYESTTRPQSKLTTTDIDPNIIRMSKEQYERDEAERRKQENLQKLKQQYEKHEQDQQSKLAVEPQETTKLQNTEILNPPVSTIEPAPVSTTWRNVIASGPTPKLNKETEFPSLTSDQATSSKFLSLADLGASIGSTVWKAKNQTQTQKQTLNQPTSSRSTIHPAPLFDTKIDESNLNEKKDQIEIVNTQKKAKKKKEKQLVNNEALKVTEPPPGFGPIQSTLTTTLPPPGFEPKPVQQVQQVQQTQQQTSTKTDTYIKPDNYEQRNQDLRSSLYLLFGTFNQTEFEEFKKNSIDFRSSSLTGDEYLFKCQKLLDLPTNPDTYINKKNLEIKQTHLKLLDLLQEMLVLLPDVKKQNELFDSLDNLINRLAKTESSLSKSSSSSQKWSDANKTSLGSFQTLKKIVKCSYCEQFFTNLEFNFHQFEHHQKELSQMSINEKKVEENQEDFPVLSSTTKQKSQTSWSIGQNNSEQKSTKKQEMNEDFPALTTSLVNNNSETRFSALPTSSLFSNPSSHLSLINKKKHRLQK